eukprot:g23066.t1
MLDVERSECTASPPKPDTEPVPEAIVPAATPKATADPDDSRSKDSRLDRCEDLAEGRGSRRSRSSSSSSYSYEYSSSSSRSRSRTVQRVKVKAESTDEIPKAAPPREQRCLTSDAEKGLTIGQMVDKQIADLQDKVTRLEQALCSERGLREAADQKFRDAVQSLEGKAGDSVILQRVLASEREKLQAAQKQEPELLEFYHVQLLKAMEDFGTGGDFPMTTFLAHYTLARCDYMRYMLGRGWTACSAADAAIVDAVERGWGFCSLVRS